MAESFTTQEAKYIKDLARQDFQKLEAQAKTLPYDSYNEVEKEAINKYLQNKLQLSNSIINKNL